jgi:Coenzyme PQQ synthesis protein D (PqqD)
VWVADDDGYVNLQSWGSLLNLKSDGAFLPADQGILRATRVRVADDVVFKARQGRRGEAVLLKRKSGMFFELDRVRTRIWQLFAEHKQLAEIAQTIAAEYKVAEDRCSAELLLLVADLERHGLVLVSYEPVEVTLEGLESRVVA